MSNPQPPEIIALLKAAGCGIRRRPSIENPVENPEPPTLERITKAVRAERMNTLQTVRSVVAAVCKVTVPDLMGDSKRRELARARQIYAYAARQMTKASFPQIAAAINYADHTTIMYSAVKVEKDLDAFQPELGQVMNYMRGIRVAT